MLNEHGMSQLRRSTTQTVYTSMKTSVLIPEGHRCMAEFLSQVHECGSIHYGTLPVGEYWATWILVSPSIVLHMILIHPFSSAARTHPSPVFTKLSLLLSHSSRLCVTYTTITYLAYDFCRENTLVSILLNYG